MGDTRYRVLQDVRFDLYIPFAQWPTGFINHFAVRTTRDVNAILLTIRNEVAALDSTQAITGVATMDELVATHLAQPRFSAVLLNWLSGLALLLTGVGIYGVLAYSVAQRTGEFVIRLALGWGGHSAFGARARHALVGIGLLVGLALSFAVTRLLSRQLFGVSATDPLTFLAIALLLFAVALLACWIPMRRAAKVDPLIALRRE